MTEVNASQIIGHHNIFQYENKINNLVCKTISKTTWHRSTLFITCICWHLIVTLTQICILMVKTWVILLLYRIPNFYNLILTSMNLSALNHIRKNYKTIDSFFTQSGKPQNVLVFFC